MPRGVGVRVPLSAQTRPIRVAFFASKGTRQPVAPRVTCLREAVLLRNFCHCLTLSLKTSFQIISAIANNLLLTTSARSPLGCSGRSSTVHYLFVGLRSSLPFSTNLPNLWFSAHSLLALLKTAQPFESYY